MSRFFSCPEPVNSLLTYGPADWQPWGDYEILGFNQQHIPDLIRMATDPYLIVQAVEPEFWGPIHAWRVLAQMGAKKAIDPLIGNFNLIEAADSDWLNDDLTRALVKLGPDCIPALAMYLIDTRHDNDGRVSAEETLSEMAKEYPDYQEQVKGILISAMELFAQNDDDLNGFILAGLLDLHAVEAMPVIRRAFAANAIDITIAGDLEEVEIELGLREERETPSQIKEELAKKYPYLRELGEKVQQAAQKQQEKKEKTKEKQQKNSKKRKRRK